MFLKLSLNIKWAVISGCFVAQIQRDVKKLTGSRVRRRRSFQPSFHLSLSLMLFCISITPFPARYNNTKYVALSPFEYFFRSWNLRRITPQRRIYIILILSWVTDHICKTLSSFKLQYQGFMQDIISIFYFTIILK